MAWYARERSWIATEAIANKIGVVTDELQSAKVAHPVGDLENVKGYVWPAERRAHGRQSVKVTSALVFYGQNIHLLIVLPKALSESSISLAKHALKIRQQL